MHGEKAQIVHSVTTWRDSALEMDEKQLEQQEITELDRKIQIGLYDRVLAFLATH